MQAPQHHEPPNPWADQADCICTNPRRSLNHPHAVLTRLHPNLAARHPGRTPTPHASRAVSDYALHNLACPVIVVKAAEGTLPAKASGAAGAAAAATAAAPAGPPKDD
jgi:hypothetical protein